MQFRFTRMAVLVRRAWPCAAARLRQVLHQQSSGRSRRSATPTSSTRRATTRTPPPRYEDVITLNPDLGFAYFFLGNSYDNLYKPARKGEPENDALPDQRPSPTTSWPSRSWPGRPNPQGRTVRKLSFEYLIAAYGTDKLERLRPGRADRQGADRAGAERARRTTRRSAKLYEESGPVRRGRGAVQEGHRRQAERPGRLSDAGRLLQPPGPVRQDDGGLRAERASVEPNNPEAWHTIGDLLLQDKVVQGRQAADRDRRRNTSRRASTAEDKALALNPEYVEAMILQEHPAAPEGALREGSRPSRLS